MSPNISSEKGQTLLLGIKMNSFDYHGIGLFLPFSANRKQCVAAIFGMTKVGKSPQQSSRITMFLQIFITA